MSKKDKNDYLDYYKREQRADDITLIITILIVFIWNFLKKYYVMIVIFSLIGVGMIICYICGIDLKD